MKTWWYRKSDEIWFWLYLIVFMLFVIFVWNMPGYTSEITVGPLWQSMSAGPYGQDIRGRSTVTEGRAIVYAPIVWGGIIWQAPHKFSAYCSFSEKTTINGTEFEKTDPIQIEGQCSLQRIQFGTYLREWARPYLCAEGFSSEWRFRQASKSKEKGFEEVSTRAWVGGGLRVDVPMTRALLAYGDASVLNGHQRYETGLEMRKGRYFLGGFYRHDRFNQLPATGNSGGIQAGMRF